MKDKDQKKLKKTGLGRSLGDLLSDNEEIGNVENKVLMHKNDGSTVKIYNKVDARTGTKSNSNGTKSNSNGTKFNSSGTKSNSNGAKPDTNGTKPSTKNDERLFIGKTREEREEEARGIYRSGKPHVIPEPERIVLDGNNIGKEGVSDALGKLKKYSPRAADEFLEALRDMTEVSEVHEYQTDKSGRIIIGATKSRVKKR
jgi:hypothetical protein